MATHHTALRSGASLVAALLIAVTVGGAAVAAPSGSGRAVAAPSEASRAQALRDKLLAGKSLTRQSLGSRHAVNVKRLAARKPTAHKSATLPHLGHPAWTGTPAVPGDKRVGVAAASAPTPATTNSDDPAKGPGFFAGLSQTSGPATNVDPPDPWVAVGPDHVVQAVNLSIRTTDRQGGDPVDVSMFDFFGLVPGMSNSDPHVIYDSLHARWLATEVSWDCDTSDVSFGHGYIDFAISRTADPTGTWDRNYITFPDQLPDYPAPGTSTDKVGIASNLFDMSGSPDCLSGATPAGVEIDYLDWADLLKNGGSVYTPFPIPDVSFFTPRVAVQVPATSPALQQVMVADSGSGPGVFYFTTIGSVVAGTIDLGSIWALSDDGIVANFAVPPQPDQAGSDTIDTAVDLRPTDAIWQDNRLVFPSTYPCGGGPDDCVRVTELDTTGASMTIEPTLTQDFLVGESGKDIFMGGVGLTGNGTLHVGWTRSSATDHPSSFTAHQVLGDTLGSISAAEPLGAGSADYAGERWGDYVGVAQDPQVPNMAWDGNQYSGGSKWLTQITPLQTGSSTYHPIDPIRVLDSRINLGVSGAFSSNHSKTFQVTNGGTIPDEAVAVTGNLTVVGQTALGYVSLTVSPTNSPPSSTINFPLGQTRANNVTIPLSAAGKLSAVYRAATGKKTHLVFDVTGFFRADPSGALFHPLTPPTRILDTRYGTGLPGKLVSGVPKTLLVGDDVTVPSTATAITGNLTIVHPTKLGYVAVTKNPTASPATSTINFKAAAIQANGVFAPLDSNHALSIVYKSSAGAKVDVLLDITGYFDPAPGGLHFVPLNPSRIMDSRSSVLSGITGAFVSTVPKALDIQGHWGVPADAAAVTGNLTVTGQTGAGYVSATPDSVTLPPTSTINFPVGDTMANGIVAPLNGSGQSSFVYRAGAGKKTHLILDLSGYFK